LTSILVIRGEGATGNSNAPEAVKGDDGAARDDIGPFIAPSTMNGANIARIRRPATKVIVFQCPSGA
jgi:hypothetical protein